MLKTMRARVWRSARVSSHELCRSRALPPIQWNEEIVPLFERLASPDTTTLPQLDGDDSFKDMLLRSHLGEARYLSTTITFDAFKVTIVEDIG